MAVEQKELNEGLDEINEGERKTEDGSKFLPKHLQYHLLRQEKSGGKINCWYVGRAGHGAGWWSGVMEINSSILKWYCLSTALPHFVSLCIFTSDVSLIQIVTHPTV